MDWDRTRQRTAFVLSIADVFFGAIGVLVILIVLSSSRSDERILEAFDLRATCQGSTEADLVVTPEDGTDEMNAAQWVASLPDDRFMVRAAIRPLGNDMACYLAARKLAASHNATLEQRGATQAILSVEYWPAEGAP